MFTALLASGVWDNFATGFGIVAAVLAVGGAVLLRFQHNRHRYALMQAALERGITQFPGGQPAWLIAFRQGLMMGTLGLGLAGVGAGAWILAQKQASAPPQAIGAAQAEALYGPKPRDERGRLTAEGRQYSVAREHWQRIQARELAGQALVGSGIVLVLLGTVRMAFARAERKYFSEGEE